LESNKLTIPINRFSKQALGSEALNTLVDYSFDSAPGHVQM